MHDSIRNDTTGNGEKEKKELREINEYHKFLLSPDPEPETETESEEEPEPEPEKEFQTTTGRTTTSP